MKMRDVAMIGLGVTGVLLYQKYNKPLMKKMECMIDDTMKKADKTLENMM